MKKIEFNCHIQAPIAKVFDTMLGLNNKYTYEEWTAQLNLPYHHILNKITIEFFVN